MRSRRWDSPQQYWFWRRHVTLIILLIVSLEWGTDQNICFAQATGFIPSTGVTLPLTDSGRPFRGGFRTPLEGKGVSVGPVTLHPHFGAATIYTDNTFRTRSQKQDDVVHVLVPGVQAILPFMGQHRFLIDYNYAKRINQSFSSNDLDTMDAYGLLTLNLPKLANANIDIQGGHSRGFDERGTAVDSQSIVPNKWTTNTVLGKVEVSGAWAGARLTGRWREWRFLNNNQGITRDRTTIVTNLTLFGSITPKTYALVSVNLTNQSYDRNTQLDSFSYRFSSGLRWDITGKTRGEIRGGYEILNFDRAPIQQPGPGLSVGGNKRENIFLGGYLQWRPTPRILVNLRPSRRIRQTAVANSSTFTQTVINVNVDYEFTPRTRFFGNWGYIKDDFSDPTTLGGGREDDTISAGIGFNYKMIKWLGFRGDYRYQKRDSNLSRFDFSANSVIFSAEILF